MTRRLSRPVVLGVLTVSAAGWLVTAVGRDGPRRPMTPRTPATGCTPAPVAAQRAALAVVGDIAEAKLTAASRLVTPPRCATPWSTPRDGCADRCGWAG